TGDIESLPIFNGQYSGDVEVGERRVEIASIKVETQDHGGMTSRVETNVIPAKYNTNSTLTANVSQTGPNEFDFELTSD
ncbi:MAG: hypothetical protein GTO62_15330, partial [Planctomycetales bacterium]|nr:hypothetical protein [Planctomycetales bacterium]NIP70611.1 hypothetical protein [Planctomycetales bacterium]